MDSFFSRAFWKSPKNLFSEVNISGSKYASSFNGNNGGFSFGIENSIKDYTFRTQLEWFASEDLTIKSGYEGTKFEFGYMQKRRARNALV